MELITCKECNNEYSKEIISCPECGYPTEKTLKELKKKSNNNSLLGDYIISVIIIIIGVILLIIGLCYEIPNRKIYFSTLERYVGGDAYNAMIEASLRGGEISGATIAKTIYICSGIITSAIGIIFFSLVVNIKGVKNNEMSELQ